MQLRFGNVLVVHSWWFILLDRHGSKLGFISNFLFTISLPYALEIPRKDAEILAGNFVHLGSIILDLKMIIFQYKLISINHQMSMQSFCDMWQISNLL